MTQPSEPFLSERDDRDATAVVYRFETFRIDPTRRVLHRGSERIPIQRKPFDVLAYLVAAAPRVVSREELLRRFWSRSVNDESLTRCVSTIRKLLGDGDDPPRYVETHRARGYRFVADVSIEPMASADHANGGGRARARRRWLPVLAAIAVVLASGAWYRYWAPAPSAADESFDRIAILPLAVAAGDDWLAAAVTDHLMRAVARIEGVTVVSFADVGSDADLLALGRKLGVDALLASRLDDTPGGSTLTARLIAMPDGELVWSTQTVSRDAVTSSEQVDTLARQVAIRLRPMLQLKDRRAAVAPDAYRYYLEGRYYWSQRSAVGLTAAIDKFNQALAIDPDYSDALVGAADSWLLLPLYGARAPASAVPQARDLALKALEIDPQNARAHAVLGVIAMQYDWDWSTAEARLRQAVTLNPNDATAQQWLGELYCYRSRFDECSQQFAIARDLDPLSPVLSMQRGSVFLYQGDYVAAVDAYRDAAAMHPRFALRQYSLGLAYAGLGDWNNAIEAYEASMPELGLEIVGGPLIFALARTGQRDAAEGLLRQLEVLADERYVPPSKLGIAYLGLSNRAAALAAFESAVELHDDRLVYFGVAVHTKGLVEQPDFAAIASKIGL
ncbi:MAG: winged helix-turn-helix domain-containing protein [Pseudomonadota bacterium]